jgi:hypothetical protein
LGLYDFGGVQNFTKAKAALEAAAALAHNQLPGRLRTSSQ